jgi:hypothetical protein
MTLATAEREKNSSEAIKIGPARLSGLNMAAFGGFGSTPKLASVVKPLAKNPPGKS